MKHSFCIGLLAEGKVPPDHRVALTPAQCQRWQQHHPHVPIRVKASAVRSYADEEYRAAGLPVVDDLGDCDVLLGVKEVPIDQLISNKAYFFFSHTIKAQPYNRDLLRAVLDRQITLVDYECLTDDAGNRVVAFGHYAGIVGAYNGLRGYGLRTGRYNLRPAHACHDRADMQREYTRIDLPPNLKLAITGGGRVSQGAAEVLIGAGIRQVSPAAYVAQRFEQPVFTVLRSGDYHARHDGQPWSSDYFYRHPEGVSSTFGQYWPHTDVLIAAAYWHPKAPVLFSAADMQRPDFRIRLVADITCDIEGSIPSTRRAATVAAPFYDYDPRTGALQEPFTDPAHVTVMAVDNLPCELPRDASRDFGEQLLAHVLPGLATRGLADPLIARGCIAHAGTLQPRFAYLQDYVSAL